MPDLGPHAAFIVAAYAVTLLALAALAFVILEDDRKQRRLLAALEKRGITRRSAQPGASSANPRAKRKGRS